MFHFHFSRKLCLGNRLALLICFAFVISILIVKSSQPAAAHKVSTPEEVTRQFYSWYLGAHLPNPKRSNMATFRKYVTRSCWKRATARDIEAVFFIDAQDTDGTWANNFTVSTAKIDGQRATLEVDLNGKEMKRNLNVTLRQEGGVWKIDNVKGID
jgi:hypothetical protein